VTGRLRLLASYAWTRSRRWPSPEALAAWQERQVRRHLAWVVERSPFHRARFAGALAGGDWRTVPPVGKAETMAHFGRANTAGVRLDDALAVALRAERDRDFAPLLPGGIAVGLSSGTSGGRGVFLASPEERDRWAGAVLARVLPEGRSGFTRGLARRHRVAFFLRASSALYARVGSRRIVFDYHDLLDPFDAHVARLAARPPTILVAPPSVLRLLAGEIDAGRLRIAPERVVSVAEVLDDVDRAVIERAFGQRLHEVYQATEGFLGATCRLGTLHLNESHLVVQKAWIDRAARRFTPVVTDFSRRTQPILRHALDDVLVERAEPCPCGSAFTAIERVEGRRDDAFVLLRQGGGEQITVFADFIRRAVLLGAARADAYTAHQRADGSVVVSVSVRDDERPAAEAGVRTELGRLWETIGAAAPPVSFMAPHPAALSPVKLRRVTRERPS
jgi:putative adenylate-forming enzyme